MQKIFTAIDGMKDYILDLQKNMTRIPAISPEAGGKGEYQKAQYLETEIKKLNFDEYLRVDAPDPRAQSGARPNLIAKYYGEDKTKTLWLLAHMDVVPEGDLSLWKTNPFELTLAADGDTIYGRGVEDNQQAIAAAFTVSKAVMASGARPPVNLGIMLIADEETGNEYGINYLIKHHKDLFGPGDSFLAQDGGDPQGKTIEIAEKSVYWQKFTVTGAQAHGSRPGDGNNAFVAGAALALKLRSALYAKFDRKEPLFDPPSSTFEPTKKEANVPNINTIPGTDVFYMDMRVLPSYNLKDIDAEIAQVIAQAETDYKVKVQVETINKMASEATPLDAPLVQLYAQAVEKINGVKPEFIGIGGGTFAAEVRNLGMAAAVASKMYGEPHIPNEKSSLNFTVSDAKTIAYILLNLK